MQLIGRLNLFVKSGRNFLYFGGANDHTMQFIGIGFVKTDYVDFERIRDRAAAHDLLVSKTISEGRFREGLQNFSLHFDLSVCQFSAFNEDDKKASSGQISTELMQFHRDSTETGFLKFLDSEITVLPKAFYVLFACDWNETDPVRLEKIHLKDIKDYFQRNNSWYLWLYNYSAKSYYPKLDVPLVLEITND